jgi:hypothetical protein
VAQQRKQLRFVIIFLIFIAYFIIAARPIPRETILTPKWLGSLTGSPAETETVQPDSADEERLLPFTLGGRFGYVDRAGNFAFNNIKTGEIYLSENLWTEYAAEPAKIEIKNISGQTVTEIADMKGYPVLLDGRIFILGSEQNALSEINGNGGVMWTYEFGAPLTCIDAASGLVLTGSVDGIIEILDSQGRRIFYFEPGGSRYAVIAGCAISRNGSRFGIICGIDQQRFLLLERYGSDGDYKVVHHEFLDAGFRRPVHISFIDQDQRVIYERREGIGCYNIKSRQEILIPLGGEIAAIDSCGDNGFLFLINSYSGGLKEFIGIKFPGEGLTPFFKFRRDMRDSVFIRASFKSGDVFLGRTDSMLVAGGGTTLISFGLEEK